MNLKYFIPLALLVLPSLVFGQSLKDGIEAIEKGEFKEAVELISGVIEADDKFAEALFYRAVAYDELDEIEKSIADISAAIKLEPEKVSYYNFRASMHFKAEDNEKSLADFTKAIEIDPNDPIAFKARANLHTIMGNSRAAKRDFAAYDRLVGGVFLRGPQDAIVKLSAGNYEGALKVLNKEIKRNPRDAALYNLRGVTYYSMDAYQEAANDFSAAIYIDSTFYPAYGGRGDLFYAIGQMDDAVEDYEKVELYGEASPELFRKRAWAYFVIDSNDFALRDIATALEMDSSISSTYFTAGDIYRNMDSFSRAIEFYNEGLELENRSSVYRFRARAYNGLEDYAKAVDDFKKYLEDHEDNFDEHVNLATALGQDERYEEGRAVLNELLKEDSTFHRAHYRMAMLYFDEKKYQEAIDWNLQYLDVIKPLNDKFLISNCYGGLAWRYLFTGDFAEAEKMAKEGLRYDSKNHWIYTNYALSLLYQGKYDEAYAMYDKYKEEEYGSGNTNFANTFLKDFDDLEENGIVHEDVEKIRELLLPFKTAEEE